jgi:hypothetical protein
MPWVELSVNEIVAQLRRIQSAFADENNHADALILECAIQSLDSRLEGPTLPEVEGAGFHVDPTVYSRTFKNTHR